MPNARTSSHKTHLDHARRLLIRSARVDMQPVELLPDEVAAFSVENIHRGSAVLMKFLAWRRAALFLALCLSTLPLLLGVIDSIATAASPDVPGLLGGLGILLMIANLIAFGGLWGAWRRWDDWDRSRGVLLVTWLIGFIAPFALALFPIQVVFASSGLERQGELLLGVLGAITAVLDLGPKALSLLPGLMRAALLSKVLLPANRVSGWLIELTAPLYILLIFVVLIVPYQLAGGGLLALALFALIAAPIAIWRTGRRLKGIRDAETIIATIHRTRMATLAFNIVGGLFAFIGLIDALEGFNLGWFDALIAVVALVANVFVLSVLSLDLLLRAMIRDRAQALEAAHDDGQAQAHPELDELSAALAPERGSPAKTQGATEPTDQP